MKLITKPLHYFLQTRLKQIHSQTGDYQRILKIDYQGNLHLTSKPAKSRQVVIESDSLIFSKINAHQNAICLYSGSKPITSSIHYLSYPVNRDIINPRLLRYLLQNQSVAEEINNLYKTGIKTEISSRELLKIRVCFPEEPTDQDRLLQLIDTEFAWADSLINQTDQAISSLHTLYQAWLKRMIERSVDSGWELNTPLLSDISDIRVGKTPLADSFTKSGRLFLKMQQIQGNQIRLQSPLFYIDENSFEELFSRTYLQPGDILMNIVGPPLGKIAIVPADFPIAAYNQAMIRIRPHFPHSGHWIFWFLSQESIITLLPKKGNAGQINISVKDIKALRIPFPEEQKRIALSTQASQMSENFHFITQKLKELLQKTKLLKLKIVDHSLNQLSKND